MIKRYIKLVAAGSILPLSFAPLEIYPVAYFSLAILFYYWLDAKPKDAFFHGLIFGVAFCTSGISWIYISVHHFGGLPAILSILITALLILLFSFLIAAQGWIQSWLALRQPDWKKCLLIYPAAWVVFEWLRCHLFFNGFPWLLLGYSQTSTVMANNAHIIGVFGISLLVALINGCMCLLARINSRTTKSIATTIIVLIFCVSWASNKFEDVYPGKKLHHVVLVQGNIEQSLKWSPSHLLTTLKTYFNMTKAITTKGDLIVWPEAAIPTVPRYIPGYMKALTTLIHSKGSDLIYGAIDKDPKTNKLYNTLFVIGNHNGRYRKHHLVPFGEYFPLFSIVNPILNYFNLDVANLSAGKTNQPALVANGLKIAPFICYEIAYPALVLDKTHNKDIIVVISDDSWFGQSIALSQQLQMAQMRALETGRYVVACNNTGITAVINPHGHIIAYASIAKAMNIDSQVRAEHGSTMLMRWGFWPTWYSCALLLLIGLVKTNKRDDSKF